MPRKTKTKDHDQDDTADEASLDRDFVMARAAGALAELERARVALQEFVGHFVTPDKDGQGKKRKRAIEAALAHVSGALRGMELAEEVLGDVDPEESEPWDDEDDDDEDDEEEDDDEDDE